MVFYTYLYAGATVVFAESPETLARDMVKVRPTLMTAVPRVFEKLYARIQETVAHPAEHNRQHRISLAQASKQFAIGSVVLQLHSVMSLGSDGNAIAATVPKSVRRIWPHGKRKRAKATK